MQMRPLFEAAFAGDLHAQLTLGAMHESGQLGAPHARLALAWFVRAALHPRIIALAPASSTSLSSSSLNAASILIDNVARVARASAALGALPAALVFVAATKADARTQSDEEAATSVWWQTSNGAPQHIHLQPPRWSIADVDVDDLTDAPSGANAARDPLSALTDHAASVTARDSLAPFMSAVAPPNEGGAQPTVSLVPAVHVAVPRIPLVGDAVVPRLACVREWSGVLYDSVVQPVLQQQPRNSALAWFPFAASICTNGGDIDASIVRLCAQAANNAATLLDQVPLPLPQQSSSGRSQRLQSGAHAPDHVWHTTPAGVQQVLRALGQAPLSPATERRGMHAAPSTPSRGDHVDVKGDVALAAAAACAVVPCAAAACALFTWAAALGNTV